MEWVKFSAFQLICTITRDEIYLEVDALEKEFLNGSPTGMDCFT